MARQKCAIKMASSQSLALSMGEEIGRETMETPPSASGLSASHASQRLYQPYQCGMTPARRWLVSLMMRGSCYAMSPPF